MKNLSLLIAFLSLVAYSGNAQTTNKKGTTYGKPFPEVQVLQANKLPQALGKKDSMAVKVVGQVQDVCKAKGCWMDVKLADNSIMKVRFKDYAFFVPKDITGKTVVLNGMAYNESVSVEDQRHYAKDAKKSEAEILAIKEPKKSVTFKASEVIIK